MSWRMEIERRIGANRPRRERWRRSRHSERVADKRHLGTRCWISSGEVGPPHRLNNERKGRAPWGKWGRRRSDEQNPPGGMAWSKTSTTKKLSLSKKSRGRAGIANAPCGNERGKWTKWTTKRATHVNGGRGAGESERVLAMLYEGRCSERQHGPTNFLHRSEHDPERQRRMMQARVYGMVSATRERVRTLMKC